MNQPKVSVIIPVYNTEKYLRECLDSVVNQTLRDIEIICVDDGSTDRSPEILEEYQKIDSRVAVITQPNSGPSTARNKGLACAHGKYIDFLDSDDLLELNALEKAFQVAADNELDAIVYGLEPFFESEQLAQILPERYKHPSGATGIMSGVQYVKVSNDQGTYVSTVWIALWRRAFLEEHGIIFKEGIVQEDNLFSFQAYMAAGRVMRIPDRFYLRRVRENSIMTSLRSAKNVSGYFSCAIDVMKYGLNNADPDKEQEIKREYTQRLDAARCDYSVLSDEEKEKILFVSEIENELFNQLVKEWAQLKSLSEEQKQRADSLQYDLDCVHNSISFRIGRAITWLPCKVRGGVRCFREHGASYTVRRTLYHMGLWKDEEENL